MTEKSTTTITIVGTPHKSSAALSGAPAQLLRPITGQFILTNHGRHTNSADWIKRGNLVARHQFVHSVVHAHRRHIQQEQTTPDGPATTPRGPGTTPLRSIPCCPAGTGHYTTPQNTILPSRHRALHHSAEYHTA